jgi:hypothetical protein
VGLLLHHRAVLFPDAGAQAAPGLGDILGSQGRGHGQSNPPPPLTAAVNATSEDAAKSATRGIMPPSPSSKSLEDSESGAQHGEEESTRGSSPST